MHKKLFKILFVLLIITITIGFNGLFVNAAFLPNHAYLRQYKNQQNCGAFFSTPYSQVSLMSNYYFDNVAFITKEMWVPFGTGNEWIETGDSDGYLNGNYWAGHFLAWSQYNISTSKYVYSERATGNEYPTGTHNFEIQYVGNGMWETYVDYVKTREYSFSNTTSYQVMVGIESNDSDNQFESGCYNNCIQWKDSSNVWHDLTSATNADLDPLPYWESTYTPSTNRVTFLIDV